MAERERKQRPRGRPPDKGKGEQAEGKTGTGVVDMVLGAVTGKSPGNAKKSWLEDIAESEMDGFVDHVAKAIWQTLPSGIGQITARILTMRPVRVILARLTPDDWRFSNLIDDFRNRLLYRLKELSEQAPEAAAPVLPELDPYRLLRFVTPEQYLELWRYREKHLQVDRPDLLVEFGWLLRSFCQAESRGGQQKGRERRSA